MLDRLHDVFQRSTDRFNAAASDGGNLIERGKIGGVGHCHPQLVPLSGDGDSLQGDCRVPRQKRSSIIVNAHLSQVNRGGSLGRASRGDSRGQVEFGVNLPDVCFGHRSQFHQHLCKPLAWLATFCGILNNISRHQTGAQ